MSSLEGPRSGFVQAVHIVCLSQCLLNPYKAKRCTIFSVDVFLISSAATHVRLIQCEKLKPGFDWIKLENHLCKNILSHPSPSNS